MGKDGVPFCEKCYQKSFGVKCAYCNRFISGKVLQAGDNHHFHPTCARCTKCGDPFGDGEEMYLQGSAIWHPRCGPGPSETGVIINGVESNGHFTDTETDRMSNGAPSEMQVKLIFFFSFDLFSLIFFLIKLILLFCCMLLCTFLCVIISVFLSFTNSKHKRLDL